VAAHGNLLSWQQKGKRVLWKPIKNNLHKIKQDSASSAIRTEYPQSNADKQLTISNIPNKEKVE